MFQDEVTPSGDRAKLDELCSRLAEAVQACLSMYRCVVKEVTDRAADTKDSIFATPVLMLYDFAEAIDGVSLLAERGSANNCPQLLRTALEVQLGLRYIFETKEDYRRRCLAYDYFRHWDSLDWAQKCDPDHERGKQLRAEMLGHQFPDLFDLAEGVDVKAEVAKCEKLMGSDRYTEVRAEIARMKAGKQRVTDWYSLWSGPKNVRELASRLKVLPLYESLYRYFSSSVHGARTLKRIRGVECGQMLVTPVRSPAGLPGMCVQAAALTNALSLFLVDSLVDHLRPGLKSHYEKLIKPAMVALNEIRFNQ